MIKPEILDAMVATGCTPEQIAAVVKASMSKGKSGAERQAEYKARKDAERQMTENDVTSVSGDENDDEPLPPKEKSPTPPKEITPITETTKRARRLADDWALPASWGQWALSEGYPETTIRLQADIFADFWQARGGQGAAKLDWFKTWKNWMRKVPKTAQRFGGQQRERTILDVIDERLGTPNADIFDAFRTTIDAEPSRREHSSTDLRLVADASRH
ncbi:hypothetical protein [Rhizobium leguminosarum]|uniref:hypothetical protein n=1 Tax=Rhizobium leguminosarum TaxID=384 RepID=UPI001C93A80C|nr:hypothetical protein [Rhizobium leguminosarum]MBY5821466.1 hypothetical protein [Rhizobium leguminosarum]